MITHDLGIAAGMCDRINVMYAGRIVETGRVDELFENPQMPYSWGLLDSLPRIDDERGDTPADHRGHAAAARSTRPMPAASARAAAYARDICRERRAGADTARPRTATSPAAGRPNPTGGSMTATRPRTPRRQRRAERPRRGQDLKVYFPIRAGIFQRDDRAVKAVDGITFDDPPRRDARPRRRVGLRQEHHRPGADPPARAHRGHGDVRRRST